MRIAYDVSWLAPGGNTTNGFDEWTRERRFTVSLGSVSEQSTTSRSLALITPKYTTQKLYGKSCMGKVSRLSCMLEYQRPPSNHPRNVPRLLFAWLKLAQDVCKNFRAKPENR